MDWRVKVWGAGDCQLQHSLSGHGDWVRAVAFDAGSQRLLSAGTWDCTARVWELSTRP